MAVSDAQKKSAAKWQAANNEFISVKLRKGTDPSKDAIRAAAERDGMSVNAWIIDAIKARL